MTRAETAVKSRAIEGILSGSVTALCVREIGDTIERFPQTEEDAALVAPFAKKNKREETSYNHRWFSEFIPSSEGIPFQQWEAAKDEYLANIYNAAEAALDCKMPHPDFDVEVETARVILQAAAAAVKAA